MQSGCDAVRVRWNLEIALVHGTSLRRRRHSLSNIAWKVKTVVKVGFGFWHAPCSHRDDAYSELSIFENMSVRFPSSADLPVLITSDFKQSHLSATCLLRTDA